MGILGAYFKSGGSFSGAPYLKRHTKLREAAHLNVDYRRSV